MRELLRRWSAALGSEPGVLAAGQQLLARYGEPHRRYHDTRHLLEVLRALEELHPSPPLAVVCAAYWHDAVYDPTAPDNEQRSAALAAVDLHRLGLPRGLAEEVARLVLVTAAHEPGPGDSCGQLLCDADLAVLGAPAVRYRAYVTDVRQEYAHLDDAAFRRGRAAVLRSLVDRPHLFATEAGRLRWEAPARANVTAELAELSAGADAAPPL